MDWENPKVKFVIRALPSLCGTAVMASFWYGAWLEGHRPRIPEPAHGFTDRMVVGPGAYVQSWEATVLYCLLFGGVICGFITALIGGGLYGPQESTVWSRAIFGIAFLATLFGGVALMHS